jgi:hypothetical protein
MRIVLTRGDSLIRGVDAEAPVPAVTTILGL